MSGAEPAGNETMTLIGFAGQPCAPAGQVAASIAIASSVRRARVTILSSPRSAHRRRGELGHHASREELRRAQRFLQGQVAEGEAREDVVDAALGRLAGDRLAYGPRRSGDRLAALHDPVEVLGIL